MNIFIHAVYLNCGTSISPVCSGEKVILVCVTDQLNGHLSWLYEDNVEIVNLQQMGQQYTSNSINVNFTLLVKQEKVTPTQREVLISTAVLNNATTNITIKCSDGDINTVKACHIQIKGE